MMKAATDWPAAPTTAPSIRYFTVRAIVFR
jgi:hypothetical protein